MFAISSIAPEQISSIVERTDSENGHKGKITALFVDDMYVYSGSLDNTLIVWDKETLELQRTLFGHTEDILTILSHENSVYSGSADRSVRSWDRQTGEPIDTLKAHTGSIFSLAVDDRHLYSGATDGTVCVWNLSDLGHVESVSAQEHFVLAIVVDEDYLFAGGLDECTNLFRLSDWCHVKSLCGHEATVFSLAIDEENVYSGSGEIWWGGPGSPRPPTFESAIRVWDKNDWSCKAVLRGHSDNVNSVEVDAKFIYSISDDGTLQIYEKYSWETVLIAELSDRPVLAFFVDDETIYLGGTDNQIWSVKKSELMGLA